MEMRRPTAQWRMFGQAPAPAGAGMRRVALAFFAAGGLAALAGVAAPDPDPSDHGPLLALALACLGATGVLAAWRRPPEALLKCLPAIGLLLVGAAVAVAQPLAATPTYYLLPLLASAYFGSLRRLAADLALFAVSLTAVLALWVEPGVRVVIFLGTAIPALFVAGVVAALKQRLDAQVDDLRQLAATDPLTGALNHGAFGAELERACAGGERMTLLLFDVDHFKSINDTFGHQEGDRMLRVVSEVLAAHKRRDDALGRVGGEEFALLLHDADAAVAQLVAERVRGALHAATAVTPASLTLSVGIAERSGEVASSHALLEAADRALYLAKDRGRDRAVLVAAAA
jgi:diguanylate cyclase (GGDEF)-like protein